MNTISKFLKPSFLVAALIVSPMFAFADEYERHSDDYSVTAKVTDFKKLMFAVSSHPFTSVDGTFFVGGLAGADGTHFQTKVMGRTLQEMEANKQAAIDYFADRFGLDATDPTRVKFVGFEMLDDLKYRVVVASEDRVPAEGWKINDGGWVAIVIDPTGYDLINGRHVNPGTMFAFGDYLIEKVPGKYRSKKNIRFSYRSVEPIEANPDGSFGINCALYSDTWGEGRANGQALYMQLPNGQFAMNSRVGLTFSAFGSRIDAITSGKP